MLLPPPEDEDGAGAGPGEREGLRERLLVRHPGEEPGRPPHPEGRVGGQRHVFLYRQGRALLSHRHP